MTNTTKEIKKAAKRLLEAKQSGAHWTDIEGLEDQLFLAGADFIRTAGVDTRRAFRSTKWRAKLVTILINHAEKMSN